MLENGFTINKEASAEMVGAGGSAYVELVYNDQEFGTYVENFADYATIPENCWVTEMETTNSYGPHFEMEIPCGIKLGDSEDTVKEVVKDLKCDTNTYGETTYYSFIDPMADDYSWGCGYEIVVDEGKVKTISVANDEMPEY